MHVHIICNSWAGDKKGEHVVERPRGEHARAISVHNKRGKKGQILNDANSSAQNRKRWNQR
jgi:hypothetical protein